MESAEAAARQNSPHLAELLKNGYDVTRWHTMPNLQPQTVAAHSWGVAMIVMSLYPNTPEKMLVLQVALEHDLVEAYIGDMPRPGRTQDHKDLEARMATDKGIAHESLLNEADQNWLGWADLIEAGMHAQREYSLGNRRYEEVIARVNQYLSDAGTKIPLELRVFAQHIGLML